MERPTSNPFIVIKEATLNWWYDWINQIVMNLIWALCWVTIILGPPVTFALVHVSDELVRGTAVSPRELYEVGRKYFVKSWLWMLVNLAIGAGFVSNYLFYQQLNQSWVPWAEAIVMVLTIYWIATQFYTIPFFLLQDKQSLRLAWRNALLTVAKAPIFTLVILIYAAIILLISVASGFLIFLLGGVTLITVLSSQAARQRIKIEMAQ